MEKHQQSDQNTRMISTESTVVQQQDRCRVLHNIGIESSPHSSGDACFLNDKQSALSGDSIGEPAKMEIKKCTSEKLFRLLQSSQAKAEEEDLLCESDRINRKEEESLGSLERQI